MNENAYSQYCRRLSDAHLATEPEPRKRIVRPGETLHVGIQLMDEQQRQSAEDDSARHLANESDRIQAIADHHTRQRQQRQAAIDADPLERAYQGMCQRARDAWRAA